MSNSGSYVSSADGAVVAEAVEPETKRRRLLDAGGPIEDDETARQKMRDAWVGENLEITGFDPHNVAEMKGFRGNSTQFDRITPMGYFSYYGDLPMMRWLYINGADTREEHIQFRFPMNAIISGQAWTETARESMKWLYLHGAAKDVGRKDFWRQRTPFSYLLVNGEGRLVQWLILNGAFDDVNEPGLLDDEKVKEGLGTASKNQWLRRQYAKARKDLLDWAVELHQARFSFLTFLRGSLARQEGKATSSLACLGGKSGIMELVAEYSGVAFGRKTRIVRQLVELLPSIYKELEDIEEGWANESDSESESDGESDGESY